MTQESFVDYYEVLQVSPNADQETIERMYRLLAKRYHADNTSTGSDEKFKLLSNAYRALCVPEKRAAYDARRAENQPFLLNLFDQDAEYGDIETDVRIQQESSSSVSALWVVGGIVAFAIISAKMSRK